MTGEDSKVSLLILPTAGPNVNQMSSSESSHPKDYSNMFGGSQVVG